MPSDLPFTALTGTPTYTSSHHHTPVHMQTDGCSCCTPFCVKLTYIFNHPLVLYMTHTRTPDANRGTLTHRQAFHSQFHVWRGCPEIFTRDFGSLTGAEPRLEALIVMQESFHQDVDCGLFRSWRLLWTNTHTTTEAASLTSGV